MDLFDLSDEEKKEWEEKFASSIDALDISINYQLCCNYLKNYFFNSADDIVEKSNKIEDVQIVINSLLDQIKKELGADIPPEYYHLPIHLDRQEKRKIKSIIIEFGDAHSECECSIIAMVKDNGKKRYLTNEYFESDNTYSLCEFGVDEHVIYATKIKSVNDLRELIYK